MIPSLPTTVKGELYLKSEAQIFEDYIFTYIQETSMLVHVLPFC